MLCFCSVMFLYVLFFVMFCSVQILCRVLFRYVMFFSVPFPSVVLFLVSFLTRWTAPTPYYI